MTTAARDLLEVSVPDGWRVAPLWSLFTRSKVLGHVHEPMLSVFREHGVVRKDSLPNLNKTAEDRSIYQLVDRGWLVVNRMKAFQGSVGIAFQRGIVSGHYICFRPSHAQSSRYLNWLLRSDIYRTIFKRLSRGVRPGQIEIDNDFLRGVPVLLPPLDVQRRIADFLDDQVGRIDRLMLLRNQQIELQSERYTANLSRLFADAPKVPLRRLVSRALVGIVVQPAALYSEADDAVPALRGMDVREGEINDSPGVSISAIGNAENADSQLHTGDVVVVRTGDAGAAAVVPEWAEGWNCIDLVIVRPKSDVLPEYLEAALNASRRDKSVAQHAAGSIQQHFGVNAVLSLPVPPRSITEQGVVVREVRRARMETAGVTTLSRRSISLLEERKRSLITAAVTGEFDVSTASSRATNVALPGVGGAV